jgi:putative polyhydroxyalkanoate system protein
LAGFETLQEIYGASRSTVLAIIRIDRKHALGLEAARDLAWQWAEEVEREFGLRCTIFEGRNSDTVEFDRAGIEGTLIVAADHFLLRARLGLLLSAFRSSIESRIVQRIDVLLGLAGEGRRSCRG